MSNTDDVELAEAKMNTAKETLLWCIERGEIIDLDQYQRLVKQVKKAEHEFMKALKELDR